MSEQETKMSNWLDGQLKIPAREGSKLTNDPLQIALSQYAAQIARTGRVMPQVEREIPDLQTLASTQANELIEGFASLIRAGRRKDWENLLALAYVRGFNESTMQRMKGN